MGVRRSQHDGMHHSRQRIVIEVRRAPRYETLIFTASGSIANLPAGHWWLSLSRFRVAPLPMSRAAKHYSGKNRAQCYVRLFYGKESNRSTAARRDQDARRLRQQGSFSISLCVTIVPATNMDVPPSPIPHTPRKRRSCRAEISLPANATMTAAANNVSHGEES